MNIFKRLQKSIDLIENNLQEDISIEDISSASHYSPFHFQRLFKDSAGISVMNYLRKRRLSSAAYELCRREKRVIDIAYDYQFSYEQSFIRAFKKEFRITPAIFKRKKHNITICRKIDLNLDTFLTGSNLNPHYMLHHNKKFAGIKKYFLFDDNINYSICYRLKSGFIKKYKGIFKKYHNPALYSLVEPVPNDCKGAYFVLCVPVEKPDYIPRDMEVFEIPLHLTMSVEESRQKSVHKLRHKDLDGTFEALFNRMLPHSSYQHLNSSYSSYTTLNLSALSNNATCYSINIPVIEKNNTAGNAVFA